LLVDEGLLLLLPRGALLLSSMLIGQVESITHGQTSTHHIQHAGEAEDNASGAAKRLFSPHLR
jgi:hypothetical protein